MARKKQTSVKSKAQMTEFGIIGNEAAQIRVRQLLSSTKDEKSGHAAIVSGPSGIGKRSVIISAMSQILHSDRRVGSHPDVIILTPEPDHQIIRIDQIRTLQSRISVRPIASPTYVIIVDDAGQMTEEASNGLLKLLEEPPAPSLFFLLSTNPDALPKTIHSRCEHIRMLPVPTGEIETYLKDQKVSPASAKVLAHVALGCPGIALSMARDNELLESHKNTARDITRLMAAPIHERFTVIESLIPPKTPAATAGAILEQWTAIARDMLLLRLGIRDIQHVYIESTLHTLASAVSTSSLITMINTLFLSRRRIESNISPRLLFEDLAMCA